MLAATILTHKPPAHKGSSASVLPPPPAHPHSVPSPQGLLLTVPAGAPAFPPLHFLVTGFLSNVAGVSVRANQPQSQPVFPRSQWEQGVQSIPHFRGILARKQKATANPSLRLPASTSLPLPLRTTGALGPQSHPCLARSNM